VDRIELRDITTFGEIDACIALQRATWGMDDVDLTPARLFVVARHAGTPPIGAFDATGRLVGFVYTLPARHETGAAYYSHMLAVDEGWRDKGVGYRLKLAQRERALRDDVAVILWTFDPLQSRNAHFNLNKLGAVVRRYVVNFYGERHHTAFDAGIGSDRVFAEWWVRSPSVERALAGGSPEATGLTGGIEIPADINAIKRRDHHEALLWRLRTRQRFQSHLSRGLVAVALHHKERDEFSQYIFADMREVQLADR
jgi:predicted GNAT superfamily acetyltransferase